MIYGKQSPRIYHIWFEGIWLLALVMNCPERDVLDFLNYFKSGWCYVSGDFWITWKLCIFVKISPFLDIMFISQVVALFLEIKDFKTFIHIFQPLHNVFLKHMQNNDTEKSLRWGVGNSSSIKKNFLTHIMIYYLTVSSVWPLEIFSNARVYSVLRFICTLSKHLWLKCGWRIWLNQKWDDTS